MPRITITPRQREPIYGQLRRHLTTIDDIRVFADDDPEEAGRLALQYADDFRLFEDVGWYHDDPRDSIRLTMPPTDLRRVLMRLQAEAEGELRAAAEEERQDRGQAGLVVSALDRDALEGCGCVSEDTARAGRRASRPDRWRLALQWLHLPVGEQLRCPLVMSDGLIEVGDEDDGVDDDHLGQSSRSCSGSPGP
jgi:hypothetical protein